MRILASAVLPTSNAAGYTPAIIADQLQKVCPCVAPLVCIRGWVGVRVRWAARTWLSSSLLFVQLTCIILLHFRFSHMFPDAQPSRMGMSYVCGSLMRQYVLTKFLSVQIKDARGRIIAVFATAKDAQPILETAFAMGMLGNSMYTSLYKHPS